MEVKRQPEGEPNEETRQALWKYEKSDEKK
jgi:hypothetical protein